MMSTILSVDPTIEKLLRALDRLLTDDYTIRDKTLLEKLLTGLDASDNLLSTIPMETYGEWFASVVNIYRRRTPVSQKWSTNLYSFAVKYLALLVKTENRFLAFVEARIIQPMIAAHLDTMSTNWEHSVFNAYMSLLRTLNTHRSGILFVLEKDLWMQMFYMIDRLIRPAKYIEIQSSNYIADLIYESFEYEILHLCEPIYETISIKLFSIEKLIHNKRAGEFFVYNVYIKTLILFLNKCIGSKYESGVSQLIVQKFSLSEILVKIKTLLNIYPILLKNYTTLHLLLDRFTLWHDSDIDFILKSIFTLITMAKDIQSYKQINNIYLQAIRYSVNIKNSQLADNIKFEKELIIGQLIPLKKCAELLKSPTYDKSQFDRCIFESNNILNSCIDYDSVINEIAISSILNILDAVPTLKQESLNYLVSFFSKLIDQLVSSDKWIELCQSEVSNNYKFLEMLSHVFVCWTKILECKLFITNNTPHSLIVPLVHTHSQIFDKKFHNSNFLQNGMKLINTALNNRIHIRVQYADDLKAFDKLGTTLNILLLDKRPEIRDGCFQCISTIAIISTHNTENLFIDLLLKKDIPLTVFNIFKHDNDPFVRAKALQCLEDMVSVLQIWEISLRKTDLITHCLNLMQCEAEGIVRRQIVKLITALIKTNELSDQIFNEICIVMVHISIKDPLWEVKIFAYMFWDLVIQNCIKRLYKSNNTKSIEDILLRLSETGCLHVLYVALKEEHDLVVQKKAISLSKYLLDFKDSASKIFDIDYKFKNELVHCLSKTDQDLENCSGPKQKKSRQTDSEDNVLNSIITTNDCELLLSLKCKNASNIYPHEVCLYQKTDSYISVKDFLKFNETYDFKDCFAKSDWVISTRSGLSSMLDDIIGQFQNCCVEGADLLDCH